MAYRNVDCKTVVFFANPNDNTTGNIPTKGLERV